nr:hypothetical protein Itr_chr11CG10050 [Ipomoea trifida]
MLRSFKKPPRSDHFPVTIPRRIKPKHSHRSTHPIPIPPPRHLPEPRIVKRRHILGRYPRIYNSHNNPISLVSFPKKLPGSLKILRYPQEIPAPGSLNFVLFIRDDANHPFYPGNPLRLSRRQQGRKPRKPIPITIHHRLLSLIMTPNNPGKQVVMRLFDPAVIVVRLLSQIHDVNPFAVFQYLCII